MVEGSGAGGEDGCDDDDGGDGDHDDCCGSISAGNQSLFRYALSFKMKKLHPFKTL